MKTNDKINYLFQSIKTEYQEDSDVCMGEFLLEYTIPKKQDGIEFSHWFVIKALEKIYEWDGTEWRFLVEDNGDQWLLVEVDDQYHIDDIFSKLQDRYEAAEVTSGEWISGEQIPYRSSEGYVYSNFITISAINKFLLWDCDDEGNYNQVGIRLINDDYWEVYELDETTYDDFRYPVRNFEVTHDEDGSTHTYMVSTEKLSDAMIAKEGEYATVTDGSEAQLVDANIYHYVEDRFFYEDAKFICKKCLDIPMTLIQEITLY
tara:strand:- start:360 stop:1142 length:783 start_codon:yes stop_codon:yes gene_type:complete